MADASVTWSGLPPWATQQPQTDQNPPPVVTPAPAPAPPPADQDYSQKTFNVNDQKNFTPPASAPNYFTTDKGNPGQPGRNVATTAANSVPLPPQPQSPQDISAAIDRETARLNTIVPPGSEKDAPPETQTQQPNAATWSGPPPWATRSEQSQTQEPGEQGAGQQQQWKGPPPWQAQQQQPPATSQDAGWKGLPPWAQPQEQPSPTTQIPPAPAPGEEKASPWTPYPAPADGFQAQPQQPVPTPTLSVTPPGTSLQDYAPQQDTSDTTPVALPGIAGGIPPEAFTQSPPQDAAAAAAVPPAPTTAPGWQLTGQGYDYNPPQDTSDTTPVALPNPLPAQASAATPSPQATNAAEATLPPSGGGIPLPSTSGYTGGESENTQEIQLPEGGSTTVQQISGPAGSPVTGHAAAAEAGAIRSGLTSTGQAAAGLGHVITGTGAALAAGYQAHTRNQVPVMDAIDKGENPHVDPNDAAMQMFASAYRDATPEQRATIRQQSEAQIAALSAPSQTGFAQGAKTVGETVAAGGDFLTTQGEKITPPPGYENAISTQIGSVAGATPVYLISYALAGLPGVAGTAGLQAYSQSYQDDIKAGVAPEDAAVNAGLKAIGSAGLMTVPVARWAETLAPAEKRVFLAAVTRMGADGLIMTGITQAQQLVDNIIDKATTQPGKSLTEGLGDPRQMLATTLVGSAPGAIAVAHAGATAPLRAAQGRLQENLEALQKHLDDLTARQREGPAVPPPAPDKDLVQPGITTPPAGGTLVRATDSSGNTWIGHSGVLVNEGQNPEVDAHFRESEQNNPTNHTDLKDTQPIDDLVSSVHVSANQGITWTDATHDADGRVVVIGHDAQGNGVELPEERYSVLGQYGDPGRDMYLATHPGEAPMVVVRDPDTQTVRAVAQARPPSDEPLINDNRTFEEQDEARAAGEPVPELSAEVTPGVQPTPMPDSPNFYKRVPPTQRVPGVAAPDITDRPSLYRQAFRDAGYDPDVAANFPLPKQIQILSDHIQKTYGLKVVVDPKMDSQKAADSLLDGYRNLQWMAHGLGYPIKAMSLGGRLTLRIEPWQSRAKNVYFGLYDPNTKSIHMPDRSNSWAHEWTHALDHFLLDKLKLVQNTRGMLASSRTREGALNVTQRVPTTAEEAFANVMNAIFYDEAGMSARVMDLHARAMGTGQDARNAAGTAQRILSGARVGGIEPSAFRLGAVSRYHSQPEELLARAHEAYVADRVAKAGGGNEFITKGDQAYLSQATQRFNDLYPHGPDRDAIFKAFDDLHGILMRDQVLGRGPRAGKPGDYDILDPIHWKYVADPQSNPQVAAGLNEAVKRQTFRQRLLAGVYERAGASPDPRSRAERFYSSKDAVTPLIHSNMGQIDVWRERYERWGNHAAAHILSNILDKLGYRYGENRLQSTPFERLASRVTNVFINRLDNIMNSNGLPTSRLNIPNEGLLTNAIRGRDDQGNTPVVPPNIQKAAGEIRALLNDFRYEIQRSRINVGIPRDEAYFPIVYDERKLRADGDAATQTMTRAMQTQFNVMQGRDSTFIHSAYNEVPRDGLPRSVHDDMAELARTQEAMRAETDPQELAKLGRYEQQLLDRVHQPVRDAWAAQRADDWKFSLEDVPWAGRNIKGAAPSANPLRQRTLVAEARDIMLPYIITRPSEVLPYYFHQMGRKIAFARTFGENGEVLQKAMDDLRLAGVSREDRLEIEASMKSSLGMLNRNEMTLGYKMGIKMRAAATMALMGRATWSTIGEPMVIAAQTGMPSIAFRGFSDAMQALLHDINLAPASQRTQHLSDIASVLGITTTRLQEAMLTGRVEAFSWSPGKTMSNFYRRIGLTQLTNANKVAAVGAAHSALKIWGKQILENRRGSLFDPHGEYRELGIPNAEHTDFANWITRRDSLPGTDEISQTPQGQRWGEAVRRFVEKTVLEPTAAEKPRGANSAVGRFVYGLMSYNYAFQRAVLNPGFNRLFTAIEHDQARFGKLAGSVSGTAKWAAYATMAIGTMMAAQIPISMLRQEIFDKERADQWRRDGSYMSNIMALAFSRTGAGGVADPLMNALSGIKYEHELSSLAIGAQANFYVQALTDVIGGILGGTAGTNSAHYRAIRGAYQLLGMPTAALATALTPGGPYASWAISLLGQYATSMSAADLAARTLVGPKGQKIGQTPAQQYQEKLQEMRDQMHPPAKPKGQQEQGGHASAGLLGLADDFGLPIARAVTKVAPALRRFIPFVR